MNEDHIHQTRLSWEDCHFWKNAVRISFQFCYESLWLRAGLVTSLVTLTWVFWQSPMVLFSLRCLEVFEVVCNELLLVILIRWWRMSIIPEQNSKEMRFSTLVVKSSLSPRAKIKSVRVTVDRFSRKSVLNEVLRLLAVKSMYFHTFL